MRTRIKFSNISQVYMLKYFYASKVFYKLKNAKQMKFLLFSMIPLPKKKKIGNKEEVEIL